MSASSSAIDNISRRAPFLEPRTGLPNVHFNALLGRRLGLCVVVQLAIHIGRGAATCPQLFGSGKIYNFFTVYTRVHPTQCM